MRIRQGDEWKTAFSTTTSHYQYHVMPYGLAMKLALEEWRHWLEGADQPFTVLTDHKNLEYFHSTKRLNPSQACWQLFFNHFQFKLAYCPRSRNTNANALSLIYPNENSASKPELILPPECWVRAIQWNFDKEICNTLPYCVPSDCPAECNYVPPRLRYKLITWAHTTPASGHPGTREMLALIQGKYWWPSMSRDVNDLVLSSSTFAQAKVPRHLPAGKLLPLPTPQCPWSHLAIDFITDLP